MKHSTTIKTLAALLLFAAGMGTRAQEITLLGNGVSFPIEVQQTQTEVKPGWKILDIQLKSKFKRYLWGTKAKQLAENSLPKFIVDTDSLLLSDLVLIKLKGKKEYRSIPKPEVYQNKCIHVDFSTFYIETYGSDLFLIQPIQPLAPGEYIFTWKTLSPVGKTEDWLVWPFSVQ
jgi:hypothetical protein